MKAAFADTSAVLTVLFGEPGVERLRSIFSSLDKVYASNLLEAEARAAAARERVDAREVAKAMEHIEWVFPDRPLTREFDAVLGTGPMRGADLWHLACALYVAGGAQDVLFITMDRDQARAARMLGFRVPS